MLETEPERKVERDNIHFINLTTEYGKICIVKINESTDKSVQSRPFSRNLKTYAYYLQPKKGTLPFKNIIFSSYC